MKKLKNAVMLAMMSANFTGWALEFDDDYWFVRASMRPEMVKMAYLIWRVVAPIVTVLIVNEIKDRLEKRKEKTNYEDSRN